MPAPVGGWNTDANPWEMPVNQAPLLDNFLIRPGKIATRGGFYVAADLSSHAPLGAVSCVVGPATGTSWWALIGQLSPNAAQTTDTVTAPIARGGGAALTRGTGTCLFYYNGTISTPAISPTPGCRWINFDGLLYGIAYDDLGTNLTAADVNGNYIVWKTKMLTMPLTNIASPTITAQAAAPQGAFDLIGYQQRIWLLGGVDIPGGGTTHSCTTLFFTNPGVSGVGSASADWKDPVSGLTNQIRMDNNTNDPGVGLAKVRNGLLVFRRHSVWILRGSTTTSYSLSLVSTEVGCNDARSIVETDHGVYFMSHRGLMITNGVNLTDVSGSIKQALTQVAGWDIAYRGMAMGGSDNFDGPGYECLQMTATGDLLLSIGNGPNGLQNPPHINPSLTALYSPATRSWVRVTSSLWNTEVLNPYASSMFGPPLATNMTGSSFLVTVGDKYLTICDQSFGGALSAPRGAGSSSFPQGVQLYDYNGLQAYSIPARWLTRNVPIVGTSTLMRKFGQGKRYFLDHAFAYSGPAAGIPSGGWSVTPVDMTDTSIGAPTLLTSVATPNQVVGTVVRPGGGYTYPILPGESISRQNQDFASEISDVAFDIKIPTLNPTMTATTTSAVTELYGLGIEYQPGRDLR